MATDTPAPSYKGFRFPAEIIQHAVWLYHRFALSFRDVEELLFARGVAVTYETVRQWCGSGAANSGSSLRIPCAGGVRSQATTGTSMKSF